MDNLTEQPINVISASQVEEMTSEKIKQSIAAGSPNWITLQLMGMVLADRCIAMEPPTLELPKAA